MLLSTERYSTIERRTEMKRYRCFDTGEIWTEEEIKEIYEGEFSLMKKYSTFEEYMERLLDLGRHNAGGVIEA